MSIDLEIAPGAATNAVLTHIHPKVFTPTRAVEDQKPGRLLSTVLTTSACLHLLLIGALGWGISKAPQRPKPIRAEVPPPTIVENIQLEAPPPPEAKSEVLRQTDTPPASDLPAPAATIDAVPANAVVPFAIKVAGPVRLVADASAASEGAAPAAVVVPIEATAHSILTPEISYPPEARYRRFSGRVVVEFHTTATGDIVDVRVRASSGHDILDQAAIENLRLGRWIGEAGYFTKTYDFVLR